MKINSKEMRQFSVPFVDLQRQYKNIQKDIDRAIADVIEKGRFILGENVQSFEHEFAAYCNTKYGVGVASGTDALRLSLIALGISHNDEVISVSHTFVSTIDAIVHAGAKPVLVDIDPRTYTIDINDLETKISKNTKAIIPVHLYGHPANMKEIMEIAVRNDLYVIEDSCQAHGAEYNGRKAGSLGHCACFSFYPSKNLGCYGDGGMVVTNDRDLCERIKLLRAYGQREKYRHESIAYNSRLDEIQASILRVKLRKLDQWNQKRRKITEEYKELLSDLELELPIEEEFVKHCYHLYVIRHRERDKLQKYLKSKGIETGIHYPVPVHLQESYRWLLHQNSGLHLTEDICAQILSLPMFPELEYNEIEYVCQCLKEFLTNNNKV